MHEIYPPPYNPSKRDTVNTDYDRCVACVGVGGTFVAASL